MNLRPGETLLRCVRNTGSDHDGPRRPGQRGLYLLTHSVPRAGVRPAHHSRVEQIDPITLKTLRRCRAYRRTQWLMAWRSTATAILCRMGAGRTGSSRACVPLASLKLPIDQPYNSADPGQLRLIVTKKPVGPNPWRLTVIDAEPCLPACPAGTPGAVDRAPE
ncbi:MAG: hypothetical protein IPH64_20010, partial [Comamonadaceae bacterium]|nr:hypothetical protein [Comamonadaceae bacterium]